MALSLKLKRSFQHAQVTCDFLGETEEGAAHPTHVEDKVEAEEYPRVGVRGQTSHRGGAFLHRVARGSRFLLCGPKVQEDGTSWEPADTWAGR